MYVEERDGILGTTKAQLRARLAALVEAAKRDRWMLVSEAAFRSPDRADELWRGYQEFCAEADASLAKFDSEGPHQPWAVRRAEMVAQHEAHKLRYWQEMVGEAAENPDFDVATEHYRFCAELDSILASADAAIALQDKIFKLAEQAMANTAVAFHSGGKAEAREAVEDFKAKLEALRRQ